MVWPCPLPVDAYVAAGREVEFMNGALAGGVAQVHLGAASPRGPPIYGTVVSPGDVEWPEERGGLNIGQLP